MVSHFKSTCWPYVHLPEVENKRYFFTNLLRFNLLVMLTNLSGTLVKLTKKKEVNFILKRTFLILLKVSLHKFQNIFIILDFLTNIFVNIFLNQ